MEEIWTLNWLCYLHMIFTIKHQHPDDLKSLFLVDIRKESQNFVEWLKNGYTLNNLDKVGPTPCQYNQAHVSFLLSSIRLKKVPTEKLVTRIFLMIGKTPKYESLRNKVLKWRLNSKLRQVRAKRIDNTHNQLHYSNNVPGLQLSVPSV